MLPETDETTRRVTQVARREHGGDDAANVDRSHLVELELAKGKHVGVMLLVLEDSVVQEVDLIRREPLIADTAAVDIADATENAIRGKRLDAADSQCTVLRMPLSIRP